MDECGCGCQKQGRRRQSRGEIHQQRQARGFFNHQMVDFSSLVACCDLQCRGYYTQSECQQRSIMNLSAPTHPIKWITTLVRTFAGYFHFLISHFQSFSPQYSSNFDPFLKHNFTFKGPQSVIFVCMPQYTFLSLILNAIHSPAWLPLIIIYLPTVSQKSWLYTLGCNPPQQLIPHTLTRQFNQYYMVKFC